MGNRCFYVLALMILCQVLLGGRGVLGQEPDESSPPSGESKKGLEGKKEEKNPRKKPKKGDPPIVTEGDVEIWAPREMTMKFGLKFHSFDNLCQKVHATIPVPVNWPEQKVEVVTTEVTPPAKFDMRFLPQGSAQWVVDVPQIAMHSEFNAIITVRVTKSFIRAPKDTSKLVKPKSKTKELSWYFGDSPLIDADDRAIKKIVAEVKESEPETAWLLAEGLYDWVRDNIQYRFDETMRSTKEALKKKEGDCEEMTGIFIALCRSAGIPARKVHVPDHCYPEFYLEDEYGQGHWYPCQVAGERQFGEINEYRPILQKGDRFRLPEFSEMQSYLTVHFSCKSPPTGTRSPEIEEIRDLGELQSDPQLGIRDK